MSLVLTLNTANLSIPSFMLAVIKVLCSCYVTLGLNAKKKVLFVS